MADGRVLGQGLKLLFREQAGEQVVLARGFDEQQQVVVDLQKGQVKGFRGVARFNQVSTALHQIHHITGLGSGDEGFEFPRADLTHHAVDVLRCDLGFAIQEGRLCHQL